jgi:membrane-associated phospholipid phosphatase
VRFRRLPAFLFALAGWAVCVPARAEEASAAAPDTHRLRLRPGYRAADEFDYALSLAGFAGTLVTVLGFHRVGEPRWDSPNALDRAVQNALGAGTYRARRRYDSASNIAVIGGISWAAFDAFGLALALDRNPRVARELFWMDTEAYAVTLLLTNITKRVAQRARPYAKHCSVDAKYDPHCGTAEQNVSFYSSHSAVAATSAGLICAQHQYFRSYGGPFDGVACGGALTAMVAAGVFRVASDNHWATDVAVGYVLGFATGYGLPWLLHFSPPKPRAASESAFSLSVLPVTNGDQVTLFALGAF